VFEQPPSQQERRGNFIELQARPICRASSNCFVESCRRCFGWLPARSTPGAACRSARWPARGGALHQVARPHQMVAAAVLALGLPHGMLMEATSAP